MKLIFVIAAGLVAAYGLLLSTAFIIGLIKGKRREKHAVHLLNAFKKRGIKEPWLN